MNIKKHVFGGATVPCGQLAPKMSFTFLVGKLRPAEGRPKPWRRWGTTRRLGLQAPQLLAMGALLLAACTTTPLPRTSYAPLAKLKVEFQGGQQVVMDLNSTSDYGLGQYIQTLARQGHYNQQYIYRQVPGYFALAGKARLSGQAFQPGYTPPFFGPDGKPAKPLPEAGWGEVGAVVHVDGTVGPELVFEYGYSVADADTQPLNIRVGKITQGRSQLEGLRRGDKIRRITLMR